MDKATIPEKAKAEIKNEVRIAEQGNKTTEEQVCDNDAIVDAPRKTISEIKREIVLRSSNTANQISRRILDNEESKNKWRKYFIVFFSILLTLSLVSIGILMYFKIAKEKNISDEVIISLLVYVVVNIFSILHFMVKYVNDGEYLKLFSTVTQKMLDFVQNGSEEEPKA